MPEEKTVLPLLPLRDIVVFPFMVIPLFVGREKSIRALEHSMAEQKYIFLATQRNANASSPSQKDIYEVGTLANILQILKLTDGTMKVLVEGIQRGRILKYTSNSNYFEVEISKIQEETQVTPDIKALMRSLSGLFEEYVKLNQKIPLETVSSTESITEPHRYADTIASYMVFHTKEKQNLLELTNPVDRLTKLLGILKSEMEILKIEKRVHGRVKKQMERSQKEFYLNEQIKAIQKELGKRDEIKTDQEELVLKIKKAKMPKEIQDKAMKEYKRLELMQPMSAEATVVRNYLEWLIDIPWKKPPKDGTLKIKEAEKVLDEDHYGLEKVKERIVEHLAVMKLVKKIKGPIICLVGPPGVGKTSLGKSIARAMNRKFVRVSLGGIRDEAEIRGHRRTYIGAMPGKIIQGMKRAEARNPVFLLDEVDKMNADFRGDPASALLEVLDPEQNIHFNDHYMEIDYDLSEVLFICTANVLHSIPQPLHDRMEVIRLPGYTLDEKMAISRQFLIPKNLDQHGLTKKKIQFTANTIKKIVQEYTREAGVRNLEREIATICRKIAKKVVETGKKEALSIKPSSLQKFLGVSKFKKSGEDIVEEIGIATGLAWTEFGGELLSIEVVTTPGTGKLLLTGKLGEVMKESAQAALSYVRSRAVDLGLSNNFYSKLDIHIHIPEGAIPKDGPSAGITMAVALISRLASNPVRKNVTMTGEVTLSGRVLSIGGLKEKILAAHQAKIQHVIVPQDNEKDLSEIPAKIRKGLHFHPVRNMDDVIELSFVNKFKPRKKPSKKGTKAPFSSVKDEPPAAQIN
ncbi:MAG: endopeptidase La [Nitrospinota bacterium]|nr:endopeptidase La [Nitrospinota bacterium]